MGYTTEFIGVIQIDPPLNEAEMLYLYRFQRSRRMKRKKGPYYVSGTGPMGQHRDPDVQDHNNPDPSQPGLWCHWTPSENGRCLIWDGAEKFYDSVLWMEYLINHFLSADAVAQASMDPQFAEFQFNHVLNGIILARGEQEDDVWRLHVVNNSVSREDIELEYTTAQDDGDETPYEPPKEEEVTLSLPHGMTKEEAQRLLRGRM